MDLQDKLRKLQLNFKRNMTRLREIRGLDSLNDEIRAERDSLLEATETLKNEIDATHRDIHLEALADGKNPGDSEYRTNISTEKEAKGYEVRTAKQNKYFRSLWGGNPRNNYRWNDDEQGCSFYEAVFSGRHHPGLTTRAMTEGIGSEGGFLVPVEYAEEIHNVALENEIVLPNATVIPMISNEKKLPALDIGNHGTNLFGGFTASYSPETGTLDQNNPKARSMLLKCQKLYGFLRFSNEVFEDMSGGGRQIAEICGKGLGWYRDKFFLKGTGAGQPMGILTASCVVEVAKETGQDANTISYTNLLDMLSRLWMGSFKNAVWVAHPSTIPQLGKLSVDVGTGGSHVPVMKESDGKFSILTRPVVFTEKTVPLGDAGDIMLCDFSQYVIGLREEMRIDFSGHKYFDTDEMACRLIERHDGFPLWDESLTLEDGTTTVSPFVTLAERA